MIMITTVVLIVITNNNEQHLLILTVRRVCINLVLISYIYLTYWITVHLSNRLFIYLTLTYLPLYLFIYLTLCLSSSLSLCLCVLLFVSISMCCLSVYQSTYVKVWSVRLVSYLLSNRCPAIYLSLTIYPFVNKYIYVTWILTFEVL